MSLALDRQIFETPRSSEYFNARELQAQTGQHIDNFASVLLKELVDNALDACETAGIQPEISIEVSEHDQIRISVHDSGAGISCSTIDKILNFQTRTSDKAAYRSPTRGAQGNALKTVLGIPHALGGTAPVIIESQNVRHSIRAWTDPAGELWIDHEKEPIQCNGTKITVAIPRGEQVFFPTSWARRFSIFNPHASVRIRILEEDSKHAKSGPHEIEDSYHPSVAFPNEWRKFLPTDLTSPHWYDAPALSRLVFSHIAQAKKGGKDLTLREFVRQFRGLSGTAKAKAVCDQFSISRLSEFAENQGQIETLLDTMEAQAAAPSPNVLGTIGRDHCRARFDQWYGVKREWYKRMTGEANGIPFVVEAAVAETERSGDIYHGINFSPTFEDPFSGALFRTENFEGNGLYGFLSNAHASPIHKDWEGDTAKSSVAVHLVCPSLEFLDRGKTRLNVTKEIREAIASCLWDTCKTLYQEEERRRKDAARAARAERNQEREAERQERRFEWTMKDAVFKVLPAAIEKATGDGQYPVSARTLFYQVRPLIQAYTEKELDYGYFSQTLLTLYKEEVGPIEQLYYDPRGILYEPHSGKSVALGTREVDSYDFPSWLYNKILYVEKKGLWPIINSSKLAERYDMAVIAAEGYATEAARTLFQHADKNQGYQLFVLHDADPHGYNIARTLQEETRRMPGYQVNVIDLGLKLDEAIEMGLQDEQFTRKRAIPEALELNREETLSFTGKQTGKDSWLCRRVELNAFTAPDLIAYIEAQLKRFGALPKVLPPIDEFGPLANVIFNGELSQNVDDMVNYVLSVDRIKDQLKKILKPNFALIHQAIENKFQSDCPDSWQHVTQKELDGFLREHSGAIRTSIRRQVIDAVKEIE